jgi:hypothetical protein
MTVRHHLPRTVSPHPGPRRPSRTRGPGLGRGSGVAAPSDGSVDGEAPGSVVGNDAGSVVEVAVGCVGCDGSVVDGEAGSVVVEVPVEVPEVVSEDGSVDEPVEVGEVAGSLDVAPLGVLLSVGTCGSGVVTGALPLLPVAALPTWPTVVPVLPSSDEPVASSRPVTSAITSANRAAAPRATRRRSRRCVARTSRRTADSGRRAAYDSAYDAWGRCASRP